MCGISGLFEPAAPDWLPEITRRMTKLIRHRGPDGEGMAFFLPGDGHMCASGTDETPAQVFARNLPYCPDRLSTPVPAGACLGLGHRRLSIVDLSPAGHQPMCDVNARAWIVFNGEIYNHPELRSELEALGHRFASHTDTEVILAAYLQWGEACLPRFNGMFSFILLDLRTRQLLLARDRFGVKPLYLWPTPTGGLAMASEIKQFTAHPGWRAFLDGQMAYDFTNWGISDHTERTLFSGVTQIRGGHLLSVSLDQLGTLLKDGAKLPIRRWYTLNARVFKGSMEEAAEQFQGLLADSVKLRVRADVPVGSCLSGGLDSSSIVCLMNRLLGEKSATLQNTFSAYSETARFDERGFIEDVVRHTGARSHSVTPAPSRLLADLGRITWHQDEPFGSTSIFAQWSVFELARERGVVVMLDGQGADEALGGYHVYFHHRLVGLLLQGRITRLLSEMRELNEVQGHTWSQHARWISNILLPRGIANFGRKILGRTITAPAYLDLRRFGARAGMPLSAGPFRHDPVNSFSRAQLLDINLPMLLHWEDRDSMAHGVEARIPFLDYRLVEFCLGLPEEYKLKGAWTKRVLREGMKGVLPESVRLRRDKLGFATAEEVWMRETHRAEFRSLLEGSIEQSRGLLTPKLMDHADLILSGKKQFNFSLWRCISLAAWMDRFSVSPGN